jgi:hypothetical protein
MDVPPQAWKESFIYKDRVYDIFDRTLRSPEITSSSDMSFKITYDLIVKQGPNKILTAIYLGWGVVMGDTHTICSIVAHKDILEDVQNFCEAAKIDIPDGYKIKEMK